MLHAQAVDLDLLGAAGRATGRVALIAERIDVSQKTEIEVMKSWLSTRDEEIPGADEHATEHGPDGELIPGMVGQQELNRLAAAKGKAFNRLFVDYMIRHHGGALTMVRDLRATPGGGAEPELDAFARHVDADQAIEISRLEELQAGLPDAPIGDFEFTGTPPRSACSPEPPTTIAAPMGELGGFLKITRAGQPQRDPRERVADYGEIYEVLPEAAAREQGARCMECGVPFCHDGCPLGNLIPDWNDLVFQGRWREAIDQLHATNDFPEWTGLICPAPCEPACVLSINDDPVTIKQIELAIVERAWEEGWIVPQPPASRTGRTVAVIGSGPAGLAAAAHLNRAGHEVVVYERDESPGGLLRFGVPDFKLEKHYVDRRIAVLEAEGIRFEYGVDVGSSLSPEELLERHDALVLAIGSRVHRPLDVPGADLQGVRFAMDYLYARNRFVARGEDPADDPELTAAGKHVVVIGGGDTAMDCVGNANRERAASVTVLDTYPAPPGPNARDSVPWPEAPRRLVTTYALDEGGERRWTQTATKLAGRDGRVAAVHGTYVTPPPGPQPVPGTEFVLPADLVLVAIGFSHPEHTGAVEQLGLDLDRRGNVRAPTFATSHPAVFAAGDARIGQSLIVNAIAEGRRCARVVDRHLAALTPA